MQVNLRIPMIRLAVALFSLLLVPTLLGAEHSSSSDDDSDDKPKRYSLYEAQLGRRIDFQKKKSRGFLKRKVAGRGW